MISVLGPRSKAGPLTTIAAKRPRARGELIVLYAEAPDPELLEHLLFQPRHYRGYLRTATLGARLCACWQV